MLITPAFAQAAAGGDTNSMLMSLLPFALIFVITVSYTHLTLPTSDLV